MVTVPQPSRALTTIVTASALLACKGYVGAAGADPASGLTSVPSGAGSSAMSGAGASSVGGAGTVAPLDCSQPKIPPAPLKRLTREQYVNAVKSALGVDADVTALAADQRAGAFASNFSAAIDDLGTEQYLAMAEASAAQAAKDWSKLVPCAANGDAACEKTAIQSLGRRLYRRPLKATETTRYEALFDRYGTSTAGGFGNGLRVVVQAMLQSPSFLYVVEKAAPSAGNERPLDSFEMATRLARFLWNSVPDDALLDLAAADKLQTEADVRARAQTMLADARASSTLRSFHRQWLGLDAVTALAKDPALFPGFGAEQRDAMLDETLSFVDYVFRSADGKLETLLTAPYSFPKPALFSIYGLPSTTVSNGTAPIMLDATQRAGVLTQPAFLAVNAHAKVSAPIKRGNVVLKNLLCLTTPSPPAGVKTELPDAMIPTTQREQVKQHEENPACVGCHLGMDGIGLGFEAYDAIGAYRARDAGGPVDASGRILGTSSIDGPFNGAVELAHKLGQSEDARACVAEQWYRFAVGRPSADADACALQALRADFRAQGGDLRALVVAIAASPGFRSWGAPIDASEAAP